MAHAVTTDSIPAWAELVGEYHVGRECGCAFRNWGPPEDGHRWTIGAESTVVLPIEAHPNLVIVIDAAPWTDAAALPSQMVMFGVCGRLRETVRLHERRTISVQTMAGCEHGRLSLDIHHLSAGAPRPQDAPAIHGKPLGLIVTSLRVFRLRDAPWKTITRARLPGNIASGTLQRAATATAGLEPRALALRFASLGLDCEFGLVQRAFGAEPLDLLRFAGSTIDRLTFGLMARYANVGAPDMLRVFLSGEPRDEFKLYQQQYHLYYAVGQLVGQTTHEAVRSDALNKFPFLERKLLKTLREGSRICVLTRCEPLTVAEALGVFCALQLEGRNTLLFAVAGDVARTGEVDRLRPGLLRGHLGATDARDYATPDAWLSVLANAYLLAQEPGA